MAEKKTAAKTAEKTAAKKTIGNTSEAAESAKESVYTRADVERMVAEAVKAALAGVQPQTIQIKQEDERIHLRYQNEVMDDNLVLFGESGQWGQVTGKSGDVWVPKMEWSRFCTAGVRRMLDKRTLIVVSGFSEEEMEMLGVSYRKGEVLDERVFNKLLDMGDELIKIYPELCESNREIVARRFITAFENKDKRVYNRKLIVELNRLSKSKDTTLSKDSPERKGAFAKILEGMNAEEADEN